MNGRAYDYNLGRFLSVDPVVQAPGNSQSLNPYSYIMNNPLAGTDPTGYTCKDEGAENKCKGKKRERGKGKGFGWVTVYDRNNGKTNATVFVTHKTKSPEKIESLADINLKDVERIVIVQDRPNDPIDWEKIGLRVAVTGGTGFEGTLAVQTRIGMQIEQSNKDLAAGRIDAAEYYERSKMMAIGGAVGLGVVSLGAAGTVKEAGQAGLEWLTGVNLSWIPSFKNFGEKMFKRSLGEVGFSAKQLDKKFKHASDFGLNTTKKNPSTLKQFQDVISAHLKDKSTVKSGTYGYVKDSSVYYNPKTFNAVVLNKSGDFVTGFKLAPGTSQYNKFIKDGVLK